MRTLTVLLSLIAALLLAACSGSSSVSVSELSDEYIRAAQQAVESALITIDDLPQGWEIDPPDEDSQEDDADENDYLFTRECQPLNDLDNLPGQIADAVSDDFDGSPGQTFSTDVVAFASDDAAKDAFNLFRTLRITCSDQLRKAMVAGLRDVFAEEGATEAELATLSAVVSDLPFPQLSDHADAYRVDWQADIGGTAYRVKMHFPYWRHGNMVGSVSYRTFTGEPDMTKEALIAKIAFDKLVKAEATLNE